MARKEGDVENSPDGLGVFMAAYDWQEAMKYAKFKFEEVEKIIFSEDGEPDEKDWKLIVKLKSGKFGWLTAWCDYSGWGCQEGGSSEICDTEEQCREALKNA